MEKCLSSHMRSDTMERGFDIMKILLLEDDIELCSSIQDELQKAGYIVDAPEGNCNSCHYYYGDVRTK